MYTAAAYRAAKINKGYQLVISLKAYPSNASSFGEIQG